MSGHTDTRGLSRKEHLLGKLERGEPFNAEENAWMIELLVGGRPYPDAPLASRRAPEYGDTQPVSKDGEPPEQWHA